jgi:hypothetical protein
MKSMYVVTHTTWHADEAALTGETKVLAIFKSESLAGIYCHHHRDPHQVKITKVQVMDGTPEMNRMVLEGKAS